MVANIHLISFSSQGYGDSRKFLEQAKESNFFASMRVFSNEDILPLIKRNWLHFKVWKKRGFGFWIWKPYVIGKALASAPEGDFLVYLDQDFEINRSGAGRLFEYLEELIKKESWVGVFSAGENYRPECYVKTRAVRTYYPGFYDQDFGAYVYAGILIIRNCATSRAAVQDWAALCQRSPITDPLPIRFLEHPAFIGQDGDNGFLPLVLSKYGGYVKFADNEVTTLNSEGFQLRHVLPRGSKLDRNSKLDSTRPFIMTTD